MLKLDKKPSEEIYEITLYGTFDPPKFKPIWFAENGLLGRKEALDAEIINIDETEADFSTKLLRIKVYEGSFDIITEQLLSWNLVKEMAINVAKILEHSIDNDFSINVALHYKFKSKKKLKKVLNKFNSNKLNDIFEAPQLNEIEFSEIKKIKNGEFEKSLSLSICGREDMPNTLHLFVVNEFTFNEDSKELASHNLEEGEHVLDDSVKIINKIVSTYF